MSANLGLPAMLENQSNKEATFNTALGIVDAALTEVFTASVSAASVILTSSQFQQMARINITGATAAGRTVTVPAIKRGFVVTSADTNAQNVAIVRGLTSISVSPGEARLFFTDGTTSGLLSFAIGSVFDLSAFLPGPMVNGQLAIRHITTRPWSLPAHCAGSRASSTVAAADAAVVISLQKNGLQFGTLTIAQGATAGTFSSTATSFADGDVFSVVGPGTADSMLENLSMNFKGTR